MIKRLAAIKIQITVILMGRECVAKEGKDIESVSEPATEREIT